MELEQLIWSFRRRWPIALLVVFISLGIGTFFASRQVHAFTAEATVSITPDLNDYSSNTRLERNATNTVEELGRVSLRTAAIEDSGLEVTNEMLATMTTNRGVDSDIVSLRVTSSTPERAASLANSWADRAVRESQSRQISLDDDILANEAERIALTTEIIAVQEQISEKLLEQGASPSVVRTPEESARITAATLELRSVDQVLTRLYRSRRMIVFPTVVVRAIPETAVDKTVGFGTVEWFAIGLGLALFALSVGNERRVSLPVLRETVQDVWTGPAAGSQDATLAATGSAILDSANKTGHRLVALSPHAPSKADLAFWLSERGHRVYTVVQAIGSEPIQTSIPLSSLGRRFTEAELEPSDELHDALVLCELDHLYLLSERDALLQHTMAFVSLEESRHYESQATGHLHSASNLSDHVVAVVS